MTQAIGKALELRDEYTTHHQENVTKISSLIAKQLGLSEARRLGLRIGSNIHDNWFKHSRYRQTRYSVANAQ